MTSTPKPLDSPTRNRSSSSPFNSTPPPPSSPSVKDLPSNQLQPPSQSPLNLSSSNAVRPLADIISERFAPFDHQGSIVGPFENETARDLTFEQELGAMLLDVIIETQAWASTRPKHESQTAVQKFETKISEIMEIEKEQEKTRERLNDFVVRMKTALAALTGL
ncbi:hypothetical protein BDQ12DRAFT_636407, partial [Crucibulum laeve]